jgi:hypothetical protein
MNAIFLGAIGDPRIETGKLEHRDHRRHPLQARPLREPAAVKLLHERLCPLKDKMPGRRHGVRPREHRGRLRAHRRHLQARARPTKSRSQTMVYTRKGTERASATRSSWRASATSRSRGDADRQGQRGPRAGHLDAHLRRGRQGVSGHRHRPRLHRRGLHVDDQEPGVVRRRRVDRTCSATSSPTSARWCRAAWASRRRATSTRARCRCSSRSTARRRSTRA